jgi:L-fuconolactonase
MTHEAVRSEIIDAHQHFWRLARDDYGWLTPTLAPIYRDFSPEDLAPHLATCGVKRTILVQAAPTLAETEFLLEIAGKTEFVAGVVGWADFADPAVAGTVTRLAINPLLVGLRPMIHDIADDDWMLRPELAAAFESLIGHALVFDALVRPQHLSRLLVLADRYPRLAIVIDHGAKPLIASGTLEPWRRDISALARLPNITCKLSGLVTEAGNGWSRETLRPYIEHLLAAFGPERLIFGSDWPVLNLASGYEDWFGIVGDFIRNLPGEARAALLGGNARRIYLGRRNRS